MQDPLQRSARLTAAVRPGQDRALPSVDVIVPCFNEGPARACRLPEVSRKPGLPAVLLRRRSEFPHAVVPNAAFGLAQARQLPICHKRANAGCRQFVEHKIGRRRGGHARAVSPNSAVQGATAGRFDPRH